MELDYVPWFCKMSTVSFVRAQIYTWLESEQFTLIPPHAKDIVTDYSAALPLSMSSSIFTRTNGPIVLISSPAGRNPTSLAEVVLTRVAGAPNLEPSVTGITLADIVSETIEVPKARRMALFVAGDFYTVAQSPQCKADSATRVGLVLQQSAQQIDIFAESSIIG
jgi:hypothetical protein